MTVLSYDPFPSLEAASALQVELLPLAELLRRADFITLHVPLIESTRNMIGARELGLMKPTAILINVSRGGVVDELALLQALSDGIIAGAGVDVYTTEPIPADHLLLKAPNCVLTPHIGAHTLELIRHIGIETARNILGNLERSSTLSTGKDSRSPGSHKSLSLTIKPELFIVVFRAARARSARIRSQAARIPDLALPTGRERLPCPGWPPNKLHLTPSLLSGRSLLSLVGEARATLQREPPGGRGCSG